MSARLCRDCGERLARVPERLPQHCCWECYCAIEQVANPEHSVTCDATLAHLREGAPDER